MVLGKKVTSLLSPLKNVKATIIMTVSNIIHLKKEEEKRSINLKKKKVSRSQKVLLSVQIYIGIRQPLQKTSERVTINL